MQMFPNNSALQAIREGGYGSADFDIATQPLTYLPAEEWLPEVTSSKSVIYRTDSGEELGVHGHGYKPVAPKEMIDVTRNIIERSGLNVDGIQETIRTSHNGSRTFVQYKLPAHTYNTPDGDTASLGLLAVSSFDGTWPFMISAAAIQQACTNLQVFVNGEVAVFRAKHTRNLNIEVGSRVITNALDVFENQRELWSSWSVQPMSDNMAFQEIVQALKIDSAQKIINSRPTAPVEAVMGEMPRTNPSLEYIYAAWHKYKRRLGANRWAFYNAMTDWSTHATAQRRDAIVNIAATQNTRQAVVQNYFSKAA
tara:strand:- start:922 stop:1851 length:930 start_codon:yes stop_codon:yes gene_type:complete